MTARHLRHHGTAVLAVSIAAIFVLSAQVDLGLAQFINGAGKARGPIAGVNGIVASGTVGVPVIVATGRVTAQAAANASVSAFTVGAADASFEVSANVLVTTATTHAFTVTCAYTDEGNTARTVTMPFVLVAGSAIVTSVANGNGTVPYLGLPIHIRAKAATTITIATAAGGTYTTVAYNAEGIVKQMS